MKHEMGVAIVMETEQHSWDWHGCVLVLNRTYTQLCRLSSTKCICVQSHFLNTDVIIHFSLLSFSGELCSPSVLSVHTIIFIGYMMSVTLEDMHICIPMQIQTNAVP